MTSLNLSIRVENLERVRDALDKLSGQQARQAYANAINDAAFKARNAMVQELRSNFDRPTPFIANAPKVFKATSDNLSAVIQPTLDSRNQWSRGGKIGVDPQHVLQAQEFGGRRADKRSEVVLRRAGILPNGYQTAIPKDPFPGSDDGRGNLRGPFLTQLLSYLQAFGEQGYRANMTDRRKKSLRNQQGIGSIAAKQVYKTTLGRRYFVSYGKLRSNRSTHLAPGIWSASGTHDVKVQPVLMFVRTPNYQPRINMERIAKSADLQNYLDRRVRARVRNLAEGKPA